MIKSIKINHLRNLSDISLALKKCNILMGKNGSGKTSLLESIFLLSRGKSFRHFETKRYISHNADYCTVWANCADDEFDEFTLAIAKYKDPDTPTKLKQNGSPAQSQAAFTKRLPTLLIDPSGMNILEDGTANRRQLLDWLCFHCVPEFYRIWLDYGRLLKQRNALLKSAQLIPQDSYAFGGICTQIEAWDSQLSEKAEQLNAIRQRIFDDWQVMFNEQIERLLPHYRGQIKLRYQAGFDTEKPLQTLLSERLMSDIELGYTRIGVHRADLSISITMPLKDGKTHKEQAVNVLSRGEKKLLITALKLSGLPQVCQNNPNTTPLVLIDDIDSELDVDARRLLFETTSQLSCQLFVSSLNDKIGDEIAPFWDIDDDLAQFLVQDGQVIPIAN